MKRTTRRMEEDDWLRAVGGAAEAGVRSIIISGGEPLMGGEPSLARLESIIGRAAASGVSTLLVTNGDYLNLETARRLKKAGMNAVTVSQDTLSGVKGYKARGYKAAEAALKAGMRVSVIMALTRENYIDLPAVYRFAASRGLGLILQPAYIPKNHPRYDELALETLDRAELEKVVEAIDIWADNYGALNYPHYLRETLGLPMGNRPVNCYMGILAAVVDCDGSFLTCFHQPGLKVGNVLETPLPQLVESLRKNPGLAGSAECFGMHCVSLFTAA